MFVSATKIGQDKTSIFKLLFFTINLHLVTSHQTSTYRKLNQPLVTSIYVVFLPLEMQKRLEQQNYTSCFLALFEKEQPTNFKSGSCKNPFLQCVCVCYWFFILHDNWKTLISMKNCIHKGRIQFRFQMVQKGQNNARTYTFQAKYSISIFKFTPFLCAMNACQLNLINFSKFGNALIRKEKKTLMQQSIRKEKLRKVGLYFITACFIKTFNRIIIHFFCFASSFAAQFLLLEIRMTQEISKGEEGNDKYLRMANYNIYF